MMAPAIKVWSMKRLIPINTDGIGLSKTILAGYYKYGCATILGDTFGTSGTAVMEVYDKTTESNAGWDMPDTEISIPEE